MKTPSASELLVQETRTAERLRLLMLANECKTIAGEKKPYADYADCWGTSGRDYRV